jgi:hypothetical protein
MTTLMNRLLFTVLMMLALSVQARTVNLAWDASPSAGVGGYELQWGTSAGVYATAVDAGVLTTGTLTVPDTATVFIAVRAYNVGKTVFSPFSNEVSSAPPAPPPPATGSFSIGNTTVFPAVDSGNGNRMFGMRITVAQGVETENIRMFTVNSVGTMRFAVYDVASAGGLPRNKIVESAAIAPVVNGWTIATLPLTVLNPGDYWLIAFPSSDTQQFAADFSSGGWVLSPIIVYGPMPAAFPSGSITGAGQWSFYINVHPVGSVLAAPVALRLP